MEELEVRVNPSTFAFAQTAVSFAENAGSPTVTVLRSGDLSEAGSVDYSFMAGSASDPADYTYASGTLNFPAQISSVTLDVSLVDDSQWEGNEEFYISLSNPSNGDIDPLYGQVTVTILDDEVNTPPVALNDGPYTVLHGQSTDPIALLISDADNEPLTLTIVEWPTYGMLMVDRVNNTVTYTANSNYSGADSFSYYVSDPSSDSNTATVSFTVTNTAPVAVGGGPYSVFHGHTLADLPLQISDAEANDPLTLTIVEWPSHGMLMVDWYAYTVNYTPESTYSGPDFFTFKVDDGITESTTVTISFNVTAVNQWDGGGDNLNWNDPLNWDTDTIPTIDDDVTISAAIASTVTVSGTEAAHTLTYDGSLTVTGSLQLGASATLQDLDLAGTLSGPAVVTVHGEMNWTAGSLQDITLEIAAGAVLSIDAGASTVNLTNCILNNAGLVAWVGGDIQSTQTVFNNLVSGLLDLSHDGDWWDATGTSVINNSGEVRKSGGTDVTQLETSFITTEKVTVECGQLELLQGGDLGGLVNLAGNAFLSLVNGPFSVPLAMTTVGDGWLRLGITLNGTPTIDIIGAVQVNNFSFGLGVIQGAGMLRVLRNMNWSGGTLAGTGNVIIEPAAGGQPAGTLQIIGAANKNLDGCQLINNGTTNWVAGDISLANGARITNSAGSTFTVSCDAGMLGGQDTLFVNQGVFRKLVGVGGASATYMRVAFQHLAGASVENQGGTLTFAGTSDYSALLRAESGTKISFELAVHKLNLGASLNGDGLFQSNNSGTVHVVGPTNQIVVQNAELNLLGKITGDGSLAVQTHFTWGWGDLTDLSGGLIVQPTAILEFVNATEKKLDRSYLANYGRMQWHDGNILLDHDATIDNFGTFEIEFDGQLRAAQAGQGLGGYLRNQVQGTNSGTVLKSGGEVGGQGATEILSVRVINSGEFDLSGFSVRVQEQFQNNGGTVQLNGGTLEVQDDYIQTAGTTDLGSGNARLTVTNRAYIQTGGVTRLDAGTLSAMLGVTIGDSEFHLDMGTVSGNMTVNPGGVLAGAGMIQGDLTNDGTIYVGGEGIIGQINVTGNYNQGLINTHLWIDLGGPQDQQYDILSVGGQATLRGALHVRLLNYQPGAGTTLRVIRTSQAVPFAFDSLDPPPDLNPNRQMTQQAMGNDLLVNVQ